MGVTPVATKIILRHDTAANWTSANPVLSLGEIGLEVGTLLYKIGDGATAWNALPYREISGELISALLMSAIADPGAPSAGQMRLYAKNIGGRIMPKFAGPSGLDTPIQPALFSNGMAIIAPGAATSLTYFGLAGVSVVGTVSHPALAATSLREQMRRAAIASSAAANSASELRVAAAQCYRGESAGRGGFFFSARFALPSTTALQRCFVGLVNTTSALPTNQVISALTNVIGLGWDSADTQLQIMHNDGSGSCTKVALGAGFPVNTPSDVYELILFAAPNAASVSWRVVNLTTGAVAEGVITTDLPATNTFLGMRAYANNGGTAAAVTLELLRMYLETDY